RRFVHAHHSVCACLERVKTFRALAPHLTHGPPELGVLDETFYRSGQRADVVGRGQETGDAVFDDLADATAFDTRNREPSSHGFDDDAAEGIGVGGLNEDIELIHDLRRIRDVSGKAKARRKIGPADALVDLTAVRIGRLTPIRWIVTINAK